MSSGCDLDRAILAPGNRGDPQTRRRLVEIREKFRDEPGKSIVVNALREWSLRATHELVFANPDGKPRSHTNIINKGLIPAMLRAGVVTADGKAKYTGLHALRHFYASWLINRKEDGGLGLPREGSSRSGSAMLDRHDDGRLRSLVPAW